MRFRLTLAAGGALLAAPLLAPSFAPAFAQDMAIPQQDNAWYLDGQAAIAAKLARQPITARAKNVILMIADGNGVGTNTATRIWDGQKKGMLGEENVLSYESFPYLALSKTYNVNAQTPDSAGTGTAMQTGVKTKAGVIGLDETVARGDCAGVKAATVATIGEVLAGQGKAVGFVSTARITHATPASGYAHSADRDWEDNTALPEGCDQPDIAAQLLSQMEAGVVDVALGGGRRHFIGKETTDEEGKTGKRTDGRDLIAEAKAAGVSYVWDDESARGLNFAPGGKILGLFESSHMKYEFDRSGEPSLAEMTEIAIKQLSTNESGFFLHVEAGRVDHANHDGNLHRVVTDGVAFAEAVAKAAELTSAEDTLIIVTADHEHAIAFNGYCGRGSPITGLCHEIDDAGVKYDDKLLMADDGKPFTAVMYLNGPGAVIKKQADGSYWGERPDVTQKEAIDPEYLQQAIVPKSSETHSGEDVAIYARGPWAHLVDGTVEQSFIFHVMQHAATAQ